MIDPPLWLILLPLGAAVPVYLLRGWRFGGYLAALVSAFTGILAAILPPTHPLHLMGRVFLLDPLTQFTLAIYLLASAWLFVAGQSLRLGRHFLPLGLCIAGLFAIAAMSRHLAISSLVMTLAAIAAVPVIQDERPDSVRGAWRFLVTIGLALPFFLLAAWHIDVYRENAEHTMYLPQAAILLAMGFALWLFAFPIYSVLTTLGSSSSLSGALVLIGFPMMVLTLLNHLLAEATWFGWWEQSGQILLLIGLASAALGGMFTAIQRTLRAMLGYAALFDLGCLLIALAVQGTRGAVVLYASLVTRALGLMLLGIATETLLKGSDGDSLINIRGVGRRQPLAAIALTIGGFSIAGTPLAAGFAGRWLLLHDLAQVDERWAWLVLLAGLGVVLAYLRALFALLQADETGAHVLPSAPVPITSGFVLLILSLAAVSLSIFPSPILRIASTLVTLYPLPRL
ncbi:MAG: hypothetical protein NZ765_04310 [Anaerolineae bacterium]|nr:hypothetical protein [Anaerolineae bacterium]MDW8070619.1 proton-conducting transporter membrane subunit [Anaerolineae bacterium]